MVAGFGTPWAEAKSSFATGVEKLSLTSESATLEDWIAMVPPTSNTVRISTVAVAVPPAVVGRGQFGAEAVGLRVAVRDPGPARASAVTEAPGEGHDLAVSIGRGGAVEGDLQRRRTEQYVGRRAGHGEGVCGDGERRRRAGAVVRRSP